MSISIKLDTEDFEKRLKNFALLVRRELKKEIALTGMEVITDAKKIVPKDTSRLSTSLQVLNRRADGLGIEVGSRVKYANKMEGEIGKASGFRHAAGPRKGQDTKFLEPSVKKNEPVFLARVEKILK